MSCFSHLKGGEKSIDAKENVGAQVGFQIDNQSL